jgi:hypothetical protein
MKFWQFVSIWILVLAITAQLNKIIDLLERLK